MERSAHPSARQDWDHPSGCRAVAPVALEEWLSAVAHATDRAYRLELPIAEFVDSISILEFTAADDDCVGLFERLLPGRQGATEEELGAGGLLPPAPSFREP